MCVPSACDSDDVNSVIRSEVIQGAQRFPIDISTQYSMESLHDYAPFGGTKSITYEIYIN